VVGRAEWWVRRSRLRYEAAADLSEDLPDLPDGLSDLPDEDSLLAGVLLSLEDEPDVSDEVDELDVSLAPEDSLAVPADSDVADAELSLVLDSLDGARLSFL
jgi:hypothetical protein